jgi:subtilisin family serine protease
VFDSGIDYNHPDLNQNMWTNPGEIPENGIDDDANGYIDDYSGYDFLYQDSDPMDDYGHGTHCAGTIAAVANNGIGVAGVSWHTKVAALKWFSGYDGATMYAIEAVLYANMMDFDITSNSWHLLDGYSQGLRDAIESGDGLFVNAAGNSSLDSLYLYPYPTMNFQPH